MTIPEFFKKIFSKLLVGNCLGMIALAVFAFAGTLVFIHVYTHHGKEVVVPNICGMNQASAEKKLESLGLRMEVADSGYVNNAPAFSVLEQQIKPGEKVKPGRIILITINADGPRLIAIPDVADNCSRREAEDKLRVLGLKLGATEYVVGDPDWVYGVKVNGKNVVAGTKVSVNAPITLVVGSGGVVDEYNGNDSLDYQLNAPRDDEEEIIEGEGGASSSAHSAPAHEHSEN